MVGQRNLEIKKFQHYINKTWNGGVYATPTLMGSKSGGLIASAWASLLYIGHNNFQDYANNIRNNLDDSEQKINSKLQLIEQLLTKAEKIVQEST